MRVRAAAWADDGSLLLLALREKKLVSVRIVDRRIVDEQPALSRATQIAALGSGAALMLEADGKSRAIQGTSKRNAKIEWFHLQSLFSCGGVAYVGGLWQRPPPKTGLFRYDEAAAQWSDTSIRDFAREAGVINGESDQVIWGIAGARGPIAAFLDGSHFGALVAEWDGEAWKLRARLKGWTNTITRDPATDTVYAVGDSVWAIAPAGEPRLIIEETSSRHFLCAWVAGERGKGTLFATSAEGLLQILADGTSKLLIPRGREIIRSLCARGSSAAFVCGDELHLLRDEKWERLALGE